VTPDDPEFLVVEDVLELHALQLARYGGGGGLRDSGRLDAAVAQARTTFDGEFVHNDLFEMAAAYLFHIIQNHPFVDGNKRTGLLASLVFLDLNGLSVVHESETLYALTLGVAEGRVEKREVAATLRRICQSPTG
jgi:death-on-curing protein